LLKVEEPQKRSFYEIECANGNWSTRELERQMNSMLFERLATDLRVEFPDMKGFSPRNFLFMRTFAVAFPEEEKVKQLVSQLPWGHIQAGGRVGIPACGGNRLGRAAPLY
jgi:hypothetical protein